MDRTAAAAAADDDAGAAGLHLGAGLNVLVHHVPVSACTCHVGVVQVDVLCRLGALREARALRADGGQGQAPEHSSSASIYPKPGS